MATNQNSAILIGFSYPNTDRTLPGIIFDLYRMYNLLENYNKIIITDIEEDISDSLTINHDFGSDIFTFITRIKSRNEYVLYTNISEFKKILTRLESKNIAIIYYSGHASAGLCSAKPGPCAARATSVIVLPWVFTVTMVDGNTSDSTGLELDWFLTLKINSLFLLIDCCEPGNFDLPYELNVSRYKRTSSTKYRKNTILAITPPGVADGGQSTLARVTGSDFTKSFVNAIMDSKYDVCLINRTCCGPGIYSTHPNLYSVYDWFAGTTKGHLGVSTHNSDSNYIVIRK